MTNFTKPTYVLALKQFIKKSNRIVIFTGAGISTESGIPDFRGPKGVWKTQTPIDYRDFIASEEVRRESWRRKFSGELNLENATANSGHYAITTLVETGKVVKVITQNVDGLHQQSGTKSEFVIELHGNASYATCLSCTERFELAEIKSAFLTEGILPTCNYCGGIIKTATVSFGQSMPAVVMQKAEAATCSSDLFVVVGSSLVVYPAAGLPMLAKENGAKLVIINEQSTDLDSLFDLIIHAQIGDTLSQAID